MAREVIRIRNEFYIRSSSARVDVRARVLKQGDTFAVFDRFGDIETLAVDVSFAIEFDADFADIFELRGMNRERRGRRLQSQVRKDGLVLRYEGLDNRIRRTRIAFDPPPTRLSESVATFQIRLEAGKDANFRCAIACEVDGIPQIRSHFSTRPLWRRRRGLCNVCVPESRRFLREMNSSTIG